MFSLWFQLFFLYRLKGRNGITDRDGWVIHYYVGNLFIKSKIKYQIFRKTSIGNFWCLMYLRIYGFHENWEIWNYCTFEFLFGFVVYYHKCFVDIVYERNVERGCKSWGMLRLMDDGFMVECVGWKEKYCEKFFC